MKTNYEMHFYRKKKNQLINLNKENVFYGNLLCLKITNLYICVCMYYFFMYEQFL
jgi:hypothetical protein